MQPLIPVQNLRRCVTSETITSRAAILLLLLGSDAASRQVGMIAQDLGMSVPRVSMLGATLEKKGLVDRCIPMADMRKASLALNQAGYTAARVHRDNLIHALTQSADA